MSLALSEFIRVLKSDGIALITCPDLKSVCALIAEDRLTEAAYTSPAGPIAPLNVGMPKILGAVKDHIRLSSFNFWKTIFFLNHLLIGSSHE